ncbi:MAG: hypothetical protein ACXW28_09440, partial [Thermoanaerobaculia bacterium]
MTRLPLLVLCLLLAAVAATFVVAQEPEKKRNDPPDPAAAFQKVFQEKTAKKAAIMRDARNYLAQRYDLGDRPSQVKMFRGKPVQQG